MKTKYKWITHSVYISPSKILQNVAQCFSNIPKIAMILSVVVQLPAGIPKNCDPARIL